MSVGRPAGIQKGGVLETLVDCALARKPCIRFVSACSLLTSAVPWRIAEIFCSLTYAELQGQAHALALMSGLIWHRSSRFLVPYSGDIPIYLHVPA